MASQNFQQKKCHLLIRHLFGCRSLTIGTLTAKDDHDEYVIDNFLALRTERGDLNFYSNGANPISNTEPSYLSTDHFNLYANYPELSQSFIEVVTESKINKLILCFTAAGDEFLGISINHENGLIYISFSTDEIHFSVNETTEFSEFILSKLRHFSERDIKLISAEN